MDILCDKCNREIKNSGDIVLKLSGEVIHVRCWRKEMKDKIYCSLCIKYSSINQNCKIRVDNYFAPDAIVYKDPVVKNALNSCGDFEAKKK